MELVLILKKRDEWLLDVDKKMGVERDILASWGWVRGRKGVNAQYVRICEQIGIKDKLPMKYDKEEYKLNTKGKWIKVKDGSSIKEGKTPTLSSAADDLIMYDHYPFVAAYVKFQTLEKASSFVRDIHSERIHPKYNTLVNTGRTSCRGKDNGSCNFQQLPRLGGIRSLFKSDVGKELLITDYSAIELATLAQVSYKRYGYSVMKDLINEGKDLHRETASTCLNKDVDDITKDERQKAKAINFGRPGD